MSQRITPVLVIGAVALSSSVIAATQQKDSSDSVHSWGAWERVQTAAGPTVPQIPFRIDFVQNQNNRNGAAFEASVEEEAEDGWKGYVAFKNAQKGVISLVLNPTQQEVAVKVVSESGETHSYDRNGRFYQSGEIIPLWNGGTQAPDGYEYRHFYAEGESGRVVASPANWSAINLYRQGNDDVSFGLAETNGIGGHENVFVAGLITKIGDIQSLMSGNVTTVYSGGGWYYGSISTPGYVNNTVTVDFGNKSWNGSWGGAVDVQAAGVLNAQGFEATSVTGNGVTQGSVEGTFYGANAHALGGQLDVTKDDNRIVGVFINEQVPPK